MLTDNPCFAVGRCQRVILDASQDDDDEEEEDRREDEGEKEEEGAASLSGVASWLRWARTGYARCVAILYFVEIAGLSRLGGRGLAITRALSTAQVRGHT